MIGTVAGRLNVVNFKHIWCGNQFFLSKSQIVTNRVD
jgi:hypothetical protein